MTKIAVLGDGSWGSVLGSMLQDNGNEVTLYGNNESVNQEINAHHTNSHYMKNWKVNPNTKATGDLEKALDGAELVVFVLPTKAIRSVSKNVHKVLAQTGATPLLVTATKGIEPGSKKLVSEILTEEIYPNNTDRIVAISGPSHAENVAQKDLTAIACASTNVDNAKKIQKLFSNDYVRFYTNDDLVGVEVGGAVKNVIAIAAGILVGKHYGDDAKAALMTRGLAEITRLGVNYFGAKPMTFSGLAGIGDLIVTCTSVNSRNWRAGKQIGEGKTLDYVLKNMGQVVEGATTVKAVHELAQEKNIDMPISEAVYRVLYKNTNVDEEIKEMMGRSPKPEIRL
ncbi:NAD(P)H-dependent glycerol-3-phosphate dehydrogenase [Lactobacillus acetotolerans]|jgi:glycerol-3-phosphate dehydrogenase (NAD(P)+)|uniref:Glycerol-3-phosphate dehydrogenase [NAD(P)+] n=2 Tax=Lactobacillus acetotolerans TaxID=1600 RepID=A0A0D6A3V9_9LACO|nr:NAD(P)H-dependent glycerol-3-phosphate dehydrogenase [Lactobacillus acetotolerans]MBN7276165.1 NAD(P)H-dependent glycerol-3-phosphate dehydrogenase [Lactobacillus acetotolerans]QGV04349.1 NAD(P)H-dependent glycerol-3-phosphate dehydrogenase [Lactobacillus acetotolerans]BAQ57542.1 glycerol-3-phosphate dehydrogenase [Lactobacillus acetotolerans]HBG91682.1 NAD(P)H-dependent glycerol-3-phosphate dehydrogenase [Lactobacillus acetotolerans]HCX40356.1 NAD(P)H-dependent glycerol-3-phosphate dehydro